MSDEKKTDVNEQPSAEEKLNSANEEIAQQAQELEDAIENEQEQQENAEGSQEAEGSQKAEGSEKSALEAAQEEALKYKDAFLRAKAEQDNIRRRAEKEVANGRKFAVESFAKEMANVYDSLKLACAVELAEDADDSVKNIHEGVEVTLKQLQSAFAKNSLKEVNPEVGTKLDPNIHQAMTMIESPDVDSGCIVNVIQIGFELHDRLLRPAMVVVSK